MADKNTLNDTIYTDPNITQAEKAEEIPLAFVGPEYDYVLSVFVKIMKDELAAKNFTLALFKVAQYTETPVLTLLESFDAADEMTLNATMAYLLNGINSPTTLYGVLNPSRPNYYAGRNVLN